MTILTQTEVETRIRALHDGEYEPIGEFISTTKPMTLLHKPCGTTYTPARIKTFLNEGEGLCPTCQKAKPRQKRGTRVTEETLQETVNTRLGTTDYLYVEGFSGMKKACTFQHTPCGTTFQIDPTSLTGKRRRGCLVCANETRGPKVDENHLQNLLDEKPYGEEYEWLETYKGSNKEKLQIKHSTCGTTYGVRPNDFQQGYQCPTCSNVTSSEEESLASFVTEFLSATGEEVLRNYRISGKEIDIYLPDRNLGFEYNGYYWHSDKFKDKKAHLQKLEFFKEQGIRVYFIDSWDWMKNPEIVQDRIKSILGLNRRIYARQTELRVLTRAEEKEFLNANHIQGYAISSFAVGLYHENTLVSLLSFVKGRKNLNQAKTSMELLRSCSLLGINVVGGFSKLHKYASAYISQTYEDITELRTFADLTLSDGVVYEKNGYTLDHMSQPSYYYIYKGQKYNRFHFRKKALLEMFPDVDSSLTEFQIMDSLGASRIWNCGNLVFVKTLF